MTDIHLDSDEWSNILHCVMIERDRIRRDFPDEDYRRYLDTLVLKLEVALLGIDGP
jgi:hypothetical protein